MMIHDDDRNDQARIHPCFLPVSRSSKGKYGLIHSPPTTCDVQTQLIRVSLSKLSNQVLEWKWELSSGTIYLYIHHVLVGCTSMHLMNPFSPCGFACINWYIQIATNRHIRNEPTTCTTGNRRFAGRKMLCREFFIGHPAKDFFAEG